MFQVMHSVPLSSVDLKETVWVLVGLYGDSCRMVDIREVPYSVWVQ